MISAQQASLCVESAGALEQGLSLLAYEADVLFLTHRCLRCYHEEVLECK